MNKEEKNNLKKSIIILLLFGILAIIANLIPWMLFYNDPIRAHLYKSQIKTDLNNNDVARVKHTTTIIIHNNSSHQNKEIKKKIWKCEPPRELVLGSGTVRECEWK